MRFFSVQMHHGRDAVHAAAAQGLIEDLGAEMEATVVLGSSATGEGVRDVLEACWPLLERQPDRGWSVNPE